MLSSFFLCRFYAKEGESIEKKQAFLHNDNVTISLCLGRPGER